MHISNSIVLMAGVAMAISTQASADIFVSPNGKDTNPGTLAKPVATLHKAQELERKELKARKKVTVNLRAGTYYLSKPLVFTSEDSGKTDAETTWKAYQNESVTISGGQRISAQWKPYKGGIMMCELPEVKSGKLNFDQLFVNGELQHMARYPNYDPNAKHYHGTAADCISPERVKRWKNPVGGYLHALHAYEWGDMHYVINAVKPNGELELEGGWQNNRRMGMHNDVRFVEGIFEELDAPCEWYLDHDNGVLYFMPPAGFDLAKAKIEVAGIKHLIEFQGSKEKPVKLVTIEGLTLTQTARTFMDNIEPLLRSDWTTYRGGAVFFNGAVLCRITGCTIDQVGGNAIFVNNYNRFVIIQECQISRAGGNCVAFVGDPKTVRSPLFEYNERQAYKDIDKEKGPKGDNYPEWCTVEGCLIFQPGQIEKQTVGVQISMSHGISVRHCSVYDCPRAGINISEGTFGGHVIEYCDIFDTVKETGDHGSFNSWGRDRYWGLTDIDPNKLPELKLTDLPKLDMTSPNTLRNNRWRCDHGWDIDLDDGSSWYEIYNNLCLNGGIKNREGFYRKVENNIMVNNSFHPHVWFVGSDDVFRHNIVFTQYAPINVPKPWGSEIDYNLLHTPGKSPEPAKILQEQSGRDEHSITADAMFIDPSKGDYRVKDNSPALKLGFKNFPMDRFGVTKPSLRKIARTPQLPSGMPAPTTTEDGKMEWLGATIKNVVGLGDRSAYGLPDETGVVVIDVPKSSAAAKLGIRKGDVIIEINGLRAYDTTNLEHISDAASRPELIVWRGQKKVKLAGQ